MAVGKCVHKGCGKTFSHEDEECVYHPGPPVFHEGQKGWKCCKTRVLTFDEFMTIPPCTTGKHSTVDDTPAPPPAGPAPEDTPTLKPEVAQSAEPASQQDPAPRVPVSAATATPRPTASPAPPEADESDDPDTSIPANATCKRKNCGATHKSGSDRSAEECVHHPGAPIFHEGSKGWTCCKRRVLEFDEFLRIPGCRTKTKHLFVGPKKDEEAQEQVVESVRSDFYQTSASVMASLYLKNIDKSKSKVEFSSPTAVSLDLRTTDKKRFEQEMPLFGAIVPEKSKFKIMGTKLELELAKADGAGWPVLRGDDRPTGEIIQTGKAGRA
ncbi:hypothetical protein AAFC00_003202 [Neodothiora populina]|uniref:CORD and CS domain protein n=1 Tax=Neodothiora populina TaxID=2781224 RepID=A0ABR3P9Q8_9PEZI